MRLWRLLILRMMKAAIVSEHSGAALWGILGIEWIPFFPEMTHDFSLYEVIFTEPHLCAQLQSRYPLATIIPFADFTTQKECISGGARQIIKMTVGEEALRNE